MHAQAAAGRRAARTSHQIRTPWRRQCAALRRASARVRVRKQPAPPSRRRATGTSGPPGARKRSGRRGAGPAHLQRRRGTRPGR
ncbi:MAG: hypothetical protein MZV63_18030 [Marinilabiliales bacterium]|nr:hypothetical protein [Marinilabiliales bacterium]